jgi:hypothetical protein
MATPSHVGADAYKSRPNRTAGGSVRTGLREDVAPWREGLRGGRGSVRTGLREDGQNVVGLCEQQAAPASAGPGRLEHGHPVTANERPAVIGRHEPQHGRCACVPARTSEGRCEGDGFAGQSCHGNDYAARV